MDGGRDVCEAVLFDILLLLPVVSLLRFKTVCKSWCSIIESSTFITQQLNRNSEMDNLIVQNTKEEVIMLSGRNYEVCTNLNTEGISPDFLIVSSCNGILCLEYPCSRACWRLSLWNPATKQVRQLPESSYFSRTHRDTSLINHNCALVFDIKTNDYKIVSISISSDRDLKKSLMNDSLVQVYNMRTDSWRTMHDGVDFPIRRIYDFVHAVSKNGMCLWIGGSSTENTDVIFFFDLTEEVYGTALLPDDCNDCSSARYNKVYCSLTFVNDKVNYIEWNYGTSPCSYYEIWMMDEFGVKESWKKLYKLEDTILPCQVIDRLYGDMNGRFILVCKEGETGDEMYLYYFSTGEVHKLDYHNELDIKNYVESLVSVRSGGGTS